MAPLYPESGGNTSALMLRKAEKSVQTMLLITSDAPGIILLGGRLAGEIGAGRPLSLPVCPAGALYIEHRPFGGERAPLCVKLDWESETLVTAQRGVRVTLWPECAELSLTPPPLYAYGLTRTVSGLDVTLRPATGELIVCLGDGGAACAVPVGADWPHITRLHGAVVLSGRCPEGEYAVVLDSACRHLLFSDTGRAASMQKNGRLRIERALDDLPGAVRAEEWLPEGDMSHPLSVATLWPDGAPRRPHTPRDTALCAARFIMLGETERAAALFVGRRIDDAARAVCAYDACLPLPFAPRAGRNAVALMKRQNDSLTRADAAYYRAVPDEESGWLLESLRVDERIETTL